MLRRSVLVSMHCDRPTGSFSAHTMTVTIGATPTVDCGGGDFIIATTTIAAGRGGIIIGSIAMAIDATSGATVTIAPTGTIAAGVSVQRPSPIGLHPALLQGEHAGE